MSVHANAVIIAKVLTIVTTLMMRVSLLPDFRRMHKNHSTGDMSIMPCLLLFVNCYAVMFYAIAIDDMLPLFATSILGIVTGRPRRLRGNGSVASVRRHDHGLGTTVGMYMSPMATIVRVVRTKTASSMPFTMGIVNVLNSSCWALYSGLVGNMFILVPNIAGLTLATTQLVLTYIYRRKPQTGEDMNPYDHGALSFVVVSPVQNGSYDRKLSGVDGPSFVAIQSPSRVDSKSWRNPRNSSESCR
ncbi:hypothetical protein PHYPSEUDO_008756 [Phytophthora pseudosyringae]|uniref:Sugar transporter SWEET1 n=1 Tax=Phytophthora pseudosyringae TaxID=221518 RepID=A0A8T1VDH6_9STRA|nr:hypothetical protein PHYPSEUDO_008756 [Phytophthora pseudosyringae]